LWLNELKKRNRAVFRETEYHENTEKETENIKTGVSENEVRREVFSFLDKLGGNCKKILILFYYEEKSMRDIFQEMNYESEQVARNMKYKCMKKLHELLDANSHIKQSFKNLLVHG
jgi:DNA-directed RNA polymerase specialized sigma24 family protein